MAPLLNTPLLIALASARPECECAPAAAHFASSDNVVDGDLVRVEDVRNVTVVRNTFADNGVDNVLHLLYTITDVDDAEASAQVVGNVFSQVTGEVGSYLALTDASDDADVTVRGNDLHDVEMCQQLMRSDVALTADDNYLDALVEPDAIGAVHT